LKLLLALHRQKYSGMEAVFPSTWLSCKRDKNKATAGMKGKKRG
jgi:hypothetical protein